MTDEDTGNQGHNVADTKKLISECATGMNEITEQRKELNEAAGNIRDRLKEAGIQVKAFEYARKLYNMEVEARGSYMDDLRLSMESLGIGGQGDLLAPMEDAAAA